MGTKHALLALFLASVPTVATAGEKPAQAPDQGAKPDTQATLFQAADAVDRTLHDADDAVARAAGDLGRTGLTGTAARERVAALCDALPYAVNCAVLDARGNLVIAAPAAYLTVEGVSVAQQAHVKQLLDTHRPVVSDAFRSVEGMDAISIAEPIFAKNGRFLGAVSVLARPGSLIGHAVEPIVGEGGPEVFVAQKDGYLLYDPDSEEIGRNVLTDPMFEGYSGLRDAMHHMASASEGTDQYRFLGRGHAAPVDKRVQWTTVRLHGAEWRVAAAESLQAAPPPVAKYEEPAIPIPAEVGLHSLVTIADGHLEDIARDLDLISTTDDVRSGQWPRVAEQLDRVSDVDVPAVYWFARPDGSYDTVGAGPESATLSDRPYFARALRGQQVLGDLVVSKSTGRNTAVVAVPVKDDDGEVVGVLGASVYLDQLSATISREMGLTEGTWFYAFDQDQRLALYPNPERVFLRAGELGPEVETWFDEMQQKGQGTIRYTYQGEPRTLVYERSPVTGWTYAFGYVGERTRPGA